MDHRLVPAVLLQFLRPRQLDYGSWDYIGSASEILGLQAPAAEGFDKPDVPLNTILRALQSAASGCFEAGPGGQALQQIKKLLQVLA